MNGKEIEYTITLPATRLVGAEIIDLEEVLQSSARSSTLSYEVIDGNTVYTYDSATEFLSDPTVPDFVREFSISLECDEGVLEIESTTEGPDDPMQLVISGAPEWARSKRAEVRDFFSAKQDKLRTFVEGAFRLELVVSASLAIAAYLFRWAGFASRYGITSQEDINRIVLSGAMITFLSRGVMDRFYPYSIIRNPNKELYPALRRLAYFIALIAAIITIHVWLISYSRR